ncbi:MAG: ATP-binding protein [Bacteroidales bacterium]|nr:ATP-binding protein [Bacteroidales bacterium]
MEHVPIQAKDVYTIGEIYDFKVRKNFTNYCELIDEQNGLTTYLQDTEKLKLFKEMIVKCRILANHEKRPKIELVDISNFKQENAGLTEDKLTALLTEKSIQWNQKEFTKLLMTEEKETTFNSQCHRWIQGLLNKKIALETVRRDCSDLLELSDLLDLCSETERDVYQNRLTHTIEQLGYYIKAAELIDNEANPEAEDTATQFINAIFEKLTVSGFIYHPSKNFNILSSLFLRRPDIMNSRIKDLLDIINQRNVAAWKKEPFRSAIIKLLELFIQESDGKIDRIRDNKELIRNIMQALSLQLMLLYDDTNSDTADYRLSAARLCLVSSYLNHLNSKKLVDLAYDTLFRSKLRKQKFSQTEVQNMIVPHLLAAHPLTGNIDTINSYTHSKATIRISPDGIQISTNKGSTPAHAVFPKELDLWKGLQIYMDEKSSTNLSSVKPNDITPYKKSWEEIEFTIFNASPKQVKTNTKSKKQHNIDETVKITFVRQDEKDRNKYYCQIEDEIGGAGFIHVCEDIVPYQIGASLRHFFASDGSRYVFTATIVDKEEDGFHFSMAEELKNWINENEFYTNDEDIICSLGGKTLYNGMAPAISAEGVSVSITNADKFDGLDRNSIVRCRRIGPGNGTFHILCEIEDISEYDYDLNSAFCYLMESYSVDRISEKNLIQEEDKQIMESDKVLDETYVREVIYLIDRMAWIDQEYVKSYNYLGFARILCLLTGWESQAAYYKGRMDVITMLHYFAINSKVDEEKLQGLTEINSKLFSNNEVLNERFNQLLTVSFLGKPDHNDDLQSIAKEYPPLKELASLVLAYNITKSYKMESTSTDIHNRIKQQLNLKGFESGLKLYGTGEESIDTEYKTSIVFACNDTSGIPNQGKQMQEILKVIDSFLNTSGGTLYVGVNDSGLGVGVEYDLNTPLYNCNKDKYVRTIIDAVASKWGNGIATTFIQEIHFDTENEDKDVLIVKINPHKQGIALDGEWWVRVGSTKRRLTSPEFLEFQKENRRLTKPVAVAVETTTPQESISVPSGSLDIMPSSPLVTSKEDEIRTSRIRKNILAEYLDPENFVEPIGFLKFLGEGKFRKLDTYDYDEENSLLTLTVLDDEKKDFLILGYENGHIVKVSIEELLEYSNRDYSRNTDSKLIFASIAKSEDSVLTICKENKAKPKVVVRLDTISKFGEARLMDGGDLPYNEGLMGKILAFDIIPLAQKKDYSSVLDKTKSFLGYPYNTTTKDMINNLRLCGIKEI